MLTAGSITRTNTARWWWCNGAAVNSLSVAFPISAWANSLALLGLLGETNLRENCSLARFPSVARYTALCSHYTIDSFVDCIVGFGAIIKLCPHQTVLPDMTYLSRHAVTSFATAHA